MTVTLHIATIVTQANVVIAEVLVTTHFTITIIIISIVWVKSQQVFQPCGMRSLVDLLSAKAQAYALHGFYWPLQLSSRVPLGGS